MVSVVISPLSFLILCIWVLSLLFLMSLVEGLPILFIFSKNQLLDSLIFCIIFLDSISFISTLVFIISFLLLTLDFGYCSISSSFKCEGRLFIWAFSCLLRQVCNAMNFPLRVAFPVSHRFWIVVFIFICFKVSFHLFLYLMLFSLHVSVCFSVLLMWLISSFIALWSEKMLNMISIFLTFLRPICVLTCGLS